MWEWKSIVTMFTWYSQERWVSYCLLSVAGIFIFAKHVYFILILNVTSLPPLARPSPAPSLEIWPNWLPRLLSTNQRLVLFTTDQSEISNHNHYNWPIRDWYCLTTDQSDISIIYYDWPLTNQRIVWSVLFYDWPIRDYYLLEVTWHSSCSSEESCFWSISESRSFFLFCQELLPGYDSEGWVCQCRRQGMMWGSRRNHSYWS